MERELEIWKVAVMKRVSDERSRVFIDIQDSRVDLAIKRSGKKASQFIKPLLKDALGMVGVVATKVSWSQKAGCICGCSPAFILAGHRGFDIWVHVRYAD